MQPTPPSVKFHQQTNWVEMNLSEINWLTTRCHSPHNHMAATSSKPILQKSDAVDLGDLESEFLTSTLAITNRLHCEPSPSINYHHQLQSPSTVTTTIAITNSKYNYNQHQHHHQYNQWPWSSQLCSPSLSSLTMVKWYLISHIVNIKPHIQLHWGFNFPHKCWALASNPLRWEKKDWVGFLWICWWR